MLNMHDPFGSWNRYQYKQKHHGKRGAGRHGRGVCMLPRVFVCSEAQFLFPAAGLGVAFAASETWQCGMLSISPTRWETTG